MSGGTAACAVRAGRLQLVYLFIRFPHPLVIKALLVRGQHLEEAEKFARVFLFLVGNIPKHLLSQLVINGGGKLGIKLDGFIFRCNHEPDGSHQFVMGVYATQHKYPEAKQLLGTLLKAPYSYELMDNFEKNFTNEEEFNKESVFELSYSPDGDYSWSNESGICLGCYIPQFIGPVKSGGWAKLMPNSLIVGEFTKETRPSDADTKFDKRMYASLFFDAANYGDKVPNEKWYGNNYSMDDLWEGNEGKMAGGAPSFNVNGTAGKFLIKKNTAYYVDDKAPDNMGNKEGRSSNLRVMRFAEVLLLYAEACAKTNDPDGANYALKQIRQRAGLTEKTFAQAELMNEIEHQCLLEFFAEGHRFDDLKRWYSPSEIQLIFKANGKQGAENFQEKHLYYPIPTSELNNNTAMEQTSLWK